MKKRSQESEVPRFRFLGDEQKPADETERVRVRIVSWKCPPKFPPRKDLLPSLRKYGQQTAITVNYFMVDLSSRDHLSQNHPLL